MGHIHIGYDNPEELFSASIIPWFDLFVGLQLVMIDNDVRRRELYGRAGSFRFKPYGIEMRSPSNIWITNDEYIKMVHENTVRAVNAAAEGTEVPQLLQRRVIDAINGSDRALAMRLLKDYHPTAYTLKNIGERENERERRAVQIG